MAMTPKTLLGRVATAPSVEQDVSWVIWLIIMTIDDERTSIWFIQKNDINQKRGALVAAVNSSLGAVVDDAETLLLENRQVEAYINDAPGILHYINHQNGGFADRNLQTQLYAIVMMQGNLEPIIRRLDLHEEGLLDDMKDKYSI